MIMICCKEMMIADEYEFADFYITKEIDSKVSSKKKKKTQRWPNHIPPQAS